MKALILVGGFGTRLRPLTLTYPKPLVEFCNKPMILHQIEALVEAGVKDIVLAVNYRPEIMVQVLKEYEKLFGINITFSIETQPLGTAGPLALARDVLAKDDSPFFVLNSDITCSYPFTELLNYHRMHGGEGTICVTKVKDPSKYGVVVNQPNVSNVECFVEKPEEFISNKINAGIYIFDTRVLDRIEAKPTSMEKEVFPAMAKDGSLHTFDLEGFWMDVGQPKDYLKGTSLYLSHLAEKQSPQLYTPKHCVCEGNVLIDPSAKIGEGCILGPDVVIGPDVVVGDGVRLQSCVVMRGAKIKDHAFVNSSIIGWRSNVERWARVEGTSVLGDDVSVKEGVYMTGTVVLPHKSVSSNVTVPIIIM
ncbi:uncharacterized protein VTP21DRAFT_7280 [Calcarisporiella thermophila]|uniref:uncharacterized protein n=1 Tax=Calcarisporiella thermophila TaxID=911321 RepID=UPI003742EBA8